MIAAPLNRLRTVYPGWWLAVGASASLSMVAGMTFWGFGLFVRPLEAEFGWSRSVISAAISLTLLVSGLASPLVGRLVDKYKPRTVILAGSAATVLVYLLLTRTEELWQLFVLLGILAFFRTWAFYIPFTTLITRWFCRRRATAMGIATAGFGMGGLVFLPVMATVISAIGWRAAFAIAALLVLLVNGTFLILARNDPAERWASHESDVAISGGSSEGIWRFNDVSSVFRTVAFWMMAAGFAFFFFGQWAFLFHGVPFFEQEDLSPSSAALILSGAAGLGVVLRVSSGVMIDRVRRFEALAAIVLFVMAIALMVLALGTSVPLLAVFALLWGVGSGIGPLLEPMLVSRLFGRTHYAAVYGAVDGVDTVVAISGPWLGGLVFDLSGSYTPVLLVYSTAFLIGGSGFLLLTRLVSRGRQQAHQGTAELVVSWQ